MSTPVGLWLASEVRGCGNSSTIPDQCHARWFEAACVELRMGPRDERDRQRIADAILMVARQGLADAEHMKAFAVQRLTAP